MKINKPHRTGDKSMFRFTICCQWTENKFRSRLGLSHLPVSVPKSFCQPRPIPRLFRLKKKKNINSKTQKVVLVITGVTAEKAQRLVVAIMTFMTERQRGSPFSSLRLLRLRGKKQQQQQKTPPRLVLCDRHSVAQRKKQCLVCSRCTCVLGLCR